MKGKSTLVKIILNQIEYQGKLIIGHNVKIGYYAQNQTELLDPDKTVFQTGDDVAVETTASQGASHSWKFSFSGDTIDKKVKVLSGGEKSRLALAKMLLEPVNLLVLEAHQSSRHDLSKDILKKCIDLKYDGTLIIVSHDRDFLQRFDYQGVRV